MPDTSSPDAAQSLCGARFVDASGQRWLVRGLRPGSRVQWVVEAEVKSQYPRIDLYVMTAAEFHARARASRFQRDLESPHGPAPELQLGKNPRAATRRREGPAAERRR